MSRSRTCEVCGHAIDGPLTCAESVLVRASPGVVYDLVTDIARTGEWSPICRESWWDEGAGPRAGAWFTGRNQTGDTEWQTRSQVDVAEPGREFAWLVGEAYVRWAYRMRPADGGTTLTESWEFRPAGVAVFHQRYGTDAHARIALRTEQAVAGIPATLAEIKRIAETG